MKNPIIFQEITSYTHNQRGLGPFLVNRITSFVVSLKYNSLNFEFTLVSTTARPLHAFGFSKNKAISSAKSPQTYPAIPRTLGLRGHGTFLGTSTFSDKNL